MSRATVLRAGWLALVVVAVFAAYWPGLHGGYVFDDFPNIVDNTRLHVTTLDWNDWLAAAFSSESGPVQRPLAMLSFALNHYFTGLAPAPMKLANIALHALNALLVFGLVRRVLQAAGVGGPHRERAALLAAALWALQPINLMAVLFIVQRMESLGHAFVFAGLWAYVAGRMRMQAAQPRGWTLVLGGLVGGTALGLAAKESAALLPLYALCVEVFAFGFRDGQGRRDRTLLALYGAVLVVPAVAGLAWLLPRFTAPAAYALRDFTLAERLWTEPRALLDYLHWTLLPDIGSLGLFHDDYRVSRGWTDPPMTLVAILALAALAAGAWLLRRRRPLVALGIAWFLCAHLLTATFLPLELVYEHRNYFASLGVVLVLVDLLYLAPSRPARRRIGAMVLLALLAMYAGLTHLRAREWRDPVTFAVTSAARHPASPRAAYQLALTYVTLSSEADPVLTDQAFAALERARAVQGSGIQPAQGLLILAARAGRPLQDAWWQDIHDKLRHRPLGPQELGALGAMTRCAEAGDCRFPPGRMLALFTAALARGEHAELLNIYGSYALNGLRDPLLALRLWERAIELAPAEAQYRINRIKLLVALGRHGDARADIATLRALGRLGQYKSTARQLEARMEGAGS